MRPSWGERLALRLLKFIPEWLALEPERVLINAACIIIGLLALVREPNPGSVLQGWPLFLRVEWALTLIVGAIFVLLGYIGGADATTSDDRAAKNARSMGRVGLLAVAACSLLYAGASFLDFGLDRFLVAVIFIFIAVAKLLRLTVSSGVRAHQLTRPEVPDREPGRHEKPEGP